jgi:molybdopterin molybdotransferase
LQGLFRERARPGRATLTGPVQSPPKRRSYLRGILDAGSGEVTPVPGQASHQLANLARANALIIVPEDVTALEAGTSVDVLDLP